MKKLLAFFLAVCVVFGCSACGGGSEEKIDTTKTQLFVSHFAGGFGSEWIYEMKKQFEYTYADISFEEGRTGVQVVINDHKTLGSKLDFATDDAYVFFNEDVPYKELVDTDKLMDISDVVNGTFDINVAMNNNDVPDVAEKNIIDKYTDLQKDALKLGNSYYAVPHYEGYYGFTYDADLFEQKGYYMYENGDFGASIEDIGLSKGPDGIAGTYDDGLPATYDDFFNLCAEIQTNGDVPLIFSGEYQFYIMNAVNALITDYNGYDNENLFYTFNGTTDEYVESISDGAPVIGNKAITNANGYDVFRQAGYYYGFSFLRRLISENNGEYLYKSNFTDGFSHTSAQNTYLLSSRTNQDDIAMLADGIWWQNEAAATFRTMESNYPNSSRATRDLKFMPLPKATAEKVGAGTTLLESQKSYTFLRKGMPEKYIPLSKLFVQFCNTTENLRLFTTLSNTPKALVYDMTESDMNKLTPFGKSLMEMKNDENTKVVYQLSTNPLYANNMTKFKKHESLAYGKYTYASKAMYDDKSLTAEKYFNELAQAWKNRWAADFGDYI